MIYGVGETVLDILFRNDQPQSAVPGGSTFNAMISLGRCGHPCAMLTQTGDDHVGELTRAYLRDNGVQTNLLSVVSGMKSHISLAFLDERSDAHYTFYKDHRAWDLTPMLDAAATVQFTPQDVLLLGSFFAVNPLVRPVVEMLLHAAHEAGAMIYYDLNYRQPHADALPEVQPLIEENIRLATVVRGSADDLNIVGIKPGKDWIVTDGPNPVCIYTKDGQLTLQPPVIEPVSTVGAGDNFNAGFISRYCRLGLTADTDRWTLEDWLSMANTGLEFGQQVCLSWENSVLGL